KLRTATGLSKLWDGVPIDRVRAGDGTLVLPGRRVAIHLMAQPDVAAIMLSDQMLLGQGLLSRCLVSAPDSTSGTRLWKQPPTSAKAAIERYEAVCWVSLSVPYHLLKAKRMSLPPESCVWQRGLGICGSRSRTP